MLLLLWSLIASDCTFSSLAFCCSGKHWPNWSCPCLGMHLTTAAELFYLQHLRSSAVAPHGCCSTSAGGNGWALTKSRMMHWASLCSNISQITWHFLETFCAHFVLPACQAYLRAMLLYYGGNFSESGVIHLHTAVALGSESPVLAATLFAALPKDMLAETLVQAWLRGLCARGACFAILHGFHMPRLVHWHPYT